MSQAALAQTESLQQESLQTESLQQESATSTTSTVSTTTESLVLAALSEVPQENIDTLNTTASNKTNFFIFLLINNKTIFLASKTLQS